MRRSLVARTAALLLGLTFTSGLLGEAYGWHRCPHHHPDRDITDAEGAAAPRAPDGNSNSSAASDRAAEASGAHGRLNVQPPPSRPLHPPQGKTCTCLGSCHGSAAVPLAPAPPAIPAADGAELQVSRPNPDGAAVVRLIPYMLPYANAPPSR